MTIIPKPTDLPGVFNAFPPKALTEEQKGWYQPTAAVRGGENFEFHDVLYESIRESRDKSHILVVGHGGCGKSTELRMLSSKLRETGIPSITIEARDDLDMNGFTYIDIFMRIVERLTRYAQENELRIHPKIIAAFREALSTEITTQFRENTTGAALELLLNFVSSITFFLKMSSGQRVELRQQIEPKMTKIINVLNALILEINSGCNNKIVIVIDGLEKCKTENARKLFSDDISSLAAIDTHLVVACPINIYRSPVGSILQGYFVNPAIMPMIKTHLPLPEGKICEEGVMVIKELILKRVHASFFEEGVLEKMITMGGGSLRDTCHLVYASAFQAYMNKRETVNMDSVLYAMNKFASDLFYRVENKYFPTIKKIYDGDHEPSNDEHLSALLYTGAVFEYNGKSWVDLHPLIRHYIENRPKLLEKLEQLEVRD